MKTHKYTDDPFGWLEPETIDDFCSLIGPLLWMAPRHKPDWAEEGFLISIYTTLKGDQRAVGLSPKGQQREFVPYGKMFRRSTDTLLGAML